MRPGGWRDRRAPVPLVSPVRLFSVLSAFCSPSPALRPAAHHRRRPRAAPPRATPFPSPGARVVLHRVGRDAAGPDRLHRSPTRAGRFRFRFRADTGALYLLSARYGGIEYFSPPVHTNPARPDTAIALVVYDTSSTAPVAVEARHLVVPRAGRGRLAGGARPDRPPERRPARPGGARLDAPLLERCRCPAAPADCRSARATSRPTRSCARVTPSRSLAPLAPGQKQLTLEYQRAARTGRTSSSRSDRAGAANQRAGRGARRAGERRRLALADSQVIEGRSFRRWTGVVPAGGTVALTLAAAAAASPTGAARARRRRGSRAAVAARRGLAPRPPP